MSRPWSAGRARRSQRARPRPAEPSQPVLPATLAPRAALHEPPPSREGASVRLGHVGDPPAWFTGWARSAAIELSWAEQWPQLLGATVDALLVDGDVLATQPDEVTRIAVAARQVGTRVVTFVGQADEVGGLTDVEIATSGAPLPRAAPLRRRLAAPVDVRGINPSGYRPEPEGPLALLLDVPSDHRGWDVARATVASLPAGVTARVYDRPGHHVDVPGAAAQRLSADPRRMVHRLRTCAGVLDHPAFSVNTQAHADRLVRLACAGVPIVVRDLPAKVRPLLGTRLSAALESARLADLRDPYRAELLSVTQRRAALASHRTAARWRQLARLVDIPVASRSVSAVLATNRPERVVHAVAQMDRQHHDALELVVVVHGGGLTPDAARQLRRSTRLPLKVRSVPASVTLGDALNAGCRLASGEVVLKVDDDDWYAADHVDDLLLALEYSGATMVGKAAEFIYLGGLDITMRRFAGKGERIDRNLAGGTLALRRDDLWAVGGWRRVPRAVDQRLIDDVVGAGGFTYRTHGFGFMLNRHGQGHTWGLGVDYFLRQASTQRPGRDLAFAGIEDVDLLADEEAV